MTDVVREQLERLWTLEKTAFPHPWRTGPINYADIYSPSGDVVGLVPKGFTETIATAGLIVTTRNALPVLLDCVEALAKLADAMPSLHPETCGRYGKSGECDCGKAQADEVLARFAALEKP